MKNLGKIKYNVLVNAFLFVVYMFIVIENGTLGIFVSIIAGIIGLAFGYFILFGIVLWSELVREIAGVSKKTKRKSAKQKNAEYDQRPIIQQLDEAFRKK